MKITRSQLKQLIKEELEQRITNLALPSMEEAEAYPTSDNPDEELPTSDGVTDAQRIEAIFEKYASIIKQMQEFMETKGTVNPEHAPIPLERMGVYEAMQTALDILEAWEYDDTPEVIWDKLGSQSPVTAALEAGAKAIGKIFGGH